MRRAGLVTPGVRFANNGYYDLAGTEALGHDAVKVWMVFLLRPTTNNPGGNRYFFGCEKATSPFNGLTLRMLSGANAGQINFFCTSTVAPGFSARAPSGTLDPAKPRWLLATIDTSDSQHARLYAGDMNAPLVETSYLSTADGGGNIDLDATTRFALGAIRVGGGAPLGTTDWEGDIWFAAYGVGAVPTPVEIREFGIRPRRLRGEVLRLVPGEFGLGQIYDDTNADHHGTRVGTTQTLAASSTIIPVRSSRRFFPAIPSFLRILIRSA